MNQLLTELLVANFSLQTKSLIRLDYQNTLDKALSRLRSLDINEALDLLYQLLEQHPLDIAIIGRIYPLEQKRKTTDGFNRICQHIFSQQSKSQEFHQLIIATWVDFKTKLESPFDPKHFSEQQVFNLFFHLGQTGYFKETEAFKNHIAEQLADHQQTPQALYFYSEQLVDKKKLLLAIKELEFLIIYYTEASTTIPAEKLLKQLRERIRNA